MGAIIALLLDENQALRPHFDEKNIPCIDLNPVIVSSFEKDFLLNVKHVN